MFEHETPDWMDPDDDITEEEWELMRKETPEDPDGGDPDEEDELILALRAMSGGKAPEFTAAPTPVFLEMLKLAKEIRESDPELVVRVDRSPLPNGQATLRVCERGTWSTHVECAALTRLMSPLLRDSLICVDVYPGFHDCDIWFSLSFAGAFLIER